MTDQSPRVRARAPGRVNLIGDHTDYTGGLVLPMAVDLGTTVVLARGGRVVDLESREERSRAVVAIDATDAEGVVPDWARYVAGVVAVLRPAEGGTGTVQTELPLGAGLSSSAALELALALALGFRGPVVELALACQRAERIATGTPTGIMDQLVCAAGVAGHALLIDCSSLAMEPVALPGGVSVLAAHSGERRSVGTSAYADRRRDCIAAEELIGPLRSATLADVVRLEDPVLRRRARHVVTENARVRDFAACLRTLDLRGAGQLMLDSHASLRDDFEVSTPALDALVERLTRLPGVHGARLTGAGFGGCVVALVDEDARGEVEHGSGARGWWLRAAPGATVEEVPDLAGGGSYEGPPGSAP